jgi:hypothetical protein
MCSIYKVFTGTYCIQFVLGVIILSGSVYLRVIDQGSEENLAAVVMYISHLLIRPSFFILWSSGYGIMQSGRWLLTFRRNILPLFSVMKIEVVACVPSIRSYPPSRLHGIIT